MLSSSSGVRAVYLYSTVSPSHGYYNFSFNVGYKSISLIGESLFFNFHISLYD